MENESFEDLENSYKEFLSYRNKCPICFNSNFLGWKNSSFLTFSNSHLKSYFPKYELKEDIDLIKSIENIKDKKNILFQIYFYCTHCASNFKNMKYSISIYLLNRRSFSNDSQIMEKITIDEYQIINFIDAKKTQIWGSDLINEIDLINNDFHYTTENLKKIITLI